MKMNRAWLVVLGVAAGAPMMAQELINYQDPSEVTRRRATSNRSNRATPAPSPAANANANGTPQAGNAAAKAKVSPTPSSRGGMKTVKKDGKETTGTVGKEATPPNAQAGPGRPGPGGKPGAAAGGGSFAQTGQLKEVTKEMIAGTRTNKLKSFDPEELANRPGIILLNPPKMPQNQSSKDDLAPDTLDLTAGKPL